MGYLRRHPRAVPYLLIAPGLAWLAVLFVVPLYYLVTTSLQSGDIYEGFSLTWRWSNYGDMLSQYRPQLVRSAQYAAIATIAALLIAYPLVYFIARRGGQWKSLLLVLLVAPFFVTYLIRTLAWQTILADEGDVVGVLRDVGILADDGRLLATSFAVVAGITYNYFPFMALPLYVALEQLDGRLLEASSDLYANPVKSFLRVTLPISLPGVFAGTLTTFIPAMGDFVNAQLLGTPKQYMIGNVIQSKFLVIVDYPLASAGAVILMVLILVGVALYARALGTERLTG
ncbi:MAG: ABC transporter permease [Actinobacteria bacterium]|nr:ABC transporter permease [Actinomycetota bacterium]